MRKTDWRERSHDIFSREARPGVENRTLSSVGHAAIALLQESALSATV